MASEAHHLKILLYHIKTSENFESFLRESMYRRKIRISQNERMKMEHNKRSSYFLVSVTLDMSQSAAGASVCWEISVRFPYLAAKYGGGISC